VSNRLYNQAIRVSRICDRAGDSGWRTIHAAEIAVLKELAQDARDGDDDWTALTGTLWLRERTRLSESAVRKAFRTLAASGHITREDVTNGAGARTRVHPIFDALPVTTPIARAASTGVFSVQGTHVLKTGDPCTGYRGLLDKITTTTMHHAGAREILDGIQGVEPPAANPPAAPAADPVDPVDAVFAAWDAMEARLGLPGPVNRDRERGWAITAMVRKWGLGRTLMLVDATGRSDFLTGRKVRGQADWRATFDQVFEVGRFAGSRLFQRILEGEFGPPVPDGDGPTASVPSPPTADQPGEPPGVRAAIVAAIGAAAASAWLSDVTFVPADDRLVVACASTFVAEELPNRFGAKIAAAARAAGHAAVAYRVRAAVGASP
jgi:hypothetical protein